MGPGRQHHRLEVGPAIAHVLEDPCAVRRQLPARRPRVPYPVERYDEHV